MSVHGVLRAERRTQPVNARPLVRADVIFNHEPATIRKLVASRAAVRASGSGDAGPALCRGACRQSRTRRRSVVLAVWVASRRREPAAEIKESDY